ncbi:ankyrin repeat-containing domain protein [Achaetomium macrosporum]|uniref:Ankyrin repeat-containing domain protein n=1 Tax=Achaetomium macrosporum TaxID=79813 RepID=A0AAN7C6V4_9PEZI|nr:ankyrin repeat-containing domain protein [Achaetomium macrosporum]
MDTASQLELERVRERNRIAKRKSRARQRQQQDAAYRGAAQSRNLEAASDTQTRKRETPQLVPSVSPVDDSGSGGSASMFGNMELDDASHSWIDFLGPEDYTEDNGAPIPKHNCIAVPSSPTPADDPLHLAPFENLSFAPCSAAADETTAPYTMFPSNGHSSGVAPLYMGYQQPAEINDIRRPDSSSAPSSNGVSSASQGMLHLAVRNGSKAIAQALLAAGASANSRDDTQALPLHLAVQNRRRSMADLLLTHGADPNVVDEAGMTPLELAVRSRDEDMVNLLLASGARVQ